MALSRPAKLTLRIAAICVAIFGLLHYLDCLELSRNNLNVSKNETLLAEETLVKSALSNCYPEEEFKRSTSAEFAKTANISPEVTGEQNNWYVEYHADYRAIFVNLGLKGNSNSVDVFDDLVTRKEDIVANSEPDKNQCISIWLVSPYGRYDMVWYDSSCPIEQVQLKNGFAIHLNPKP